MVVPTFGVMLNDWNYGIWSQIMEVHIASKDKLGYINSDLPKPAETAPTFRQWRTENAMVKSWLIGSMDPALVANFIGFPTAKGVWDAAATTYYDGSDTSQSQVSDLNKKVSNLTKIMMSIRLRFLHVPLDDESEADNHLLDDEASEPSVDDDPEAGTNLLDADASEPSIDDDPEADPTTLLEADEPADTDHSAGSLNDDPEADPTSLLAAEPTDLSADDEPEAGTILLRSDPAEAGSDPVADPEDGDVADPEDGTPGEAEGTFTPLVPTHDHLLVIGPDFAKTIATEEVFMAIPPGFEASQPGGVCKLENASNGLEESPAAWFGRLSVASDDDRNTPWDPGGRVEGNEFDDMTSLTAKALTVSEDRMDAMQMVLWNFIKAKLEVALI